MSEENAQSSGFVGESIQVITNPQSYFEVMPVSGGFGAPVTKALMYGTIAGIIWFVWSLLGYSAPGGLASLFGGGIGIMVLIGSIVGALIGLFIGGLIMLILSAICGGNTDYEANVRVVATLMVLSPLTALFGVFYGFSFMLASVIGLLINLYGVWMIYHALGGALKAKPGSTRVLSIILAAFYAIFFFMGMGAAQLADQYSGMIENPGGEEMTEMAKDLAKSMGGEEAEEAIEQVMTGKEGFNLEMANGKDIDSPSPTQLMMSMGTMDADNDFCILSNGDDFIQTSYSDKGYTLQYKDADGQFEASDLQMQGAVMMIFTTYLEGDDDWKEMAKWEKME